jgi:hypothetical protein
MQIIVILLLALALALLVLGLIGASSALVVGSIVASLVAVVVIVRARSRRIGQAAAVPDDAARSARIEAELDKRTRVLAAATSGTGRHAATPANDGSADGAGSTEADAAADSADDPPAADTVAPLSGHGQNLVWVIDGRPRYHLAACAFLLGRSGEPISLSQAVEDGFTPCSLCDPDNRIVPAD